VGQSQGRSVRAKFEQRKLKPKPKLKTRAALAQNYNIFRFIPLFCCVLFLWPALHLLRQPPGIENRRR